MNMNQGVEAVLCLQIKLNINKYVKEGDIVKGRVNGEEFNISEGKEYEILKVNNSTMVTVKNDKNQIDIYSVEYFTV